MQFINGGGLGGEADDAMNGYKAAFSKQTNSSQYGMMYSKVFDHAGFITNHKVTSANITYLNLRFGDAEKDGIIGWSMGSDTAAKFLLQTDKKFGFVVLDCGVMLSIDEIKAIAAKVKKLTIIYHQHDKMSSGLPGGISGPRNYEILSSEEFAKYKELEKELPNFSLRASDTGHHPAPEIAYP